MAHCPNLQEMLADMRKVKLIILVAYLTNKI